MERDEIMRQVAESCKTGSVISEDAARAIAETYATDSTPILKDFCAGNPPRYDWASQEIKALMQRIRERAKEEINALSALKNYLKEDEIRRMQAFIVDLFQDPDLFKD